MTREEKEKVLDLLCDKFVYGLNDEEARELDHLGYDQRDAESIEKTIAALGLVDLDSAAEMPASLTSKLLRDADDHFGADPANDVAAVPQPQIVLGGGRGRSWFDWMGWAVAAAACVALTVSLFIPRGGSQLAGQPTPTPSPEERLTPAQERQRFMESSPQMVKAEWEPGKMENVNVSGDVVWSDAKQAGYIRLRGLPKNDPDKQTYQLWIVEEGQGPKTPVDGGVFDITTDGDVIIPIDAKIRARNPQAFAITVEKPGGVVISKQEKVAAIAPVKLNQT